MVLFDNRLQRWHGTHVEKLLQVWIASYQIYIHCDFFSIVGCRGMILLMSMVHPSFCVIVSLFKSVAADLSAPEMLGCPFIPYPFMQFLETFRTLLCTFKVKGALRD